MKIFIPYHFTKEFASNLGLTIPLMNLKFIRCFSPCVEAFHFVPAKTLILPLAIKQPLPLSAWYFYKLQLQLPFIFLGVL